MKNRILIILSILLIANVSRLMASGPSLLDQAIQNTETRFQRAYLEYLFCLSDGRAFCDLNLATSATDRKIFTDWMKTVADTGEDVMSLAGHGPASRERIRAFGNALRSSPKARAVLSMCGGGSFSYYPCAGIPAQEIAKEAGKDVTAFGGDAMSLFGTREGAPSFTMVGSDSKMEARTWHPKAKSWGVSETADLAELYPDSSVKISGIQTKKTVLTPEFETLGPVCRAKPAPSGAKLFVSFAAKVAGPLLLWWSSQSSREKLLRIRAMQTGKMPSDADIFIINAMGSLYAFDITGGMDMNLDIELNRAKRIHDARLESAIQQKLPRSNKPMPLPSLSADQAALMEARARLHAAINSTRSNTPGISVGGIPLPEPTANDF